MSIVLSIMFTHVSMGQSKFPLTIPKTYFLLHHHPGEGTLLPTHIHGAMEARTFPTPVRYRTSVGATAGTHICVWVPFLYCRGMEGADPQSPCLLPPTPCVHQGVQHKQIPPQFLHYPAIILQASTHSLLILKHTIEITNKSW